MNKSVKQTIIETLARGPIDKALLIDKVTQSCGVSAQAVYKTLRELARSDVLTIHRSSVSLTIMYIETELQKWEDVSMTYNARPLTSHFLGLQEGESLTLRFKTLNELDAYWVHAFFLLERKLPEDLISYSVIPHDWFYYGRRETDIFWTEKQKRKSRLVITHPYEVDMRVLRARRQAGYGITPGVNPFTQEEWEYYTLIEDWIFKVTIDKKLHAELVKIAKDVTSIEEIDQFQLQQLLSKIGVNTMKIYRNKKRAEAMTNKVKKYFE